MKRVLNILTVTILASAANLAAEVGETELGRLFRERVPSLVAVEYFVQREEERSSQSTVGLCIDSEGHVVLLDNAMPNWLPYDQFKDFRAYVLGEGGDGFAAEYLGRDHLNGWNYLRVAEEMRERLKPFTDFEASTAYLGSSLWGIGVMGKEFDFLPYLLDGRLAMTQKLPLKIGFSEGKLGAPASPVFDMSGRFVGWIGNPIARERLLTMGTEQYKVGLRGVRESGVFLHGDEFLENIGRIPDAPDGGPRPWIGVSGMQPIEREVASFMGLRDQGAIVISTILDDSPAELGGLRNKDIVIAIDDKNLPRYRPEGIVQRHFEREVLSRLPGETMSLTVLRGEDELEVEVEVGTHPKPINLAERQYLEELGFTVREFVIRDAIRRRVSHLDSTGVIASYVKPNSAVNSAGLLRGDWIKEIDGLEIDQYGTALGLLIEIESDDSRGEFVMLIDRNNETSVVRVNLR